MTGWRWSTSASPPRPGPRPPGVDAAAVRAGRAGGHAGLGAVAGAGDRRGPGALGLRDRRTPGLSRLVSEVGLDHVGIVLGIEMSRLARSGRDWHQLLELCALSGALLGDPDGVYDPAEHNDRLLLGLKGTISEAELHLIKQRMWSGRIAKARRGELASRCRSGSCAAPPARWCWTRTSRCAAWSGWSSTCSSGSARSAPCWLSSSTTASSWASGCGRDPSAGSWPGAGRAAPALPTCCTIRPTLGSTPTAAAPWTPAAAGRAAVHRPGPPAARAVGGVPARDAAGLYQRRAVRAEHGSDWTPTGPAPEPGRGARRPGPAGRAGGLRPVRQEDDGALPARARREAAPGLRLRPRQDRLRR